MRKLYILFLLILFVMIGTGQEKKIRFTSIDFNNDVPPGVGYIFLMQSGKIIYYSGTTQIGRFVDKAELSSELDSLNTAISFVFYGRENPEKDPPKNFKSILDEIGKRKLPIKFTNTQYQITKKDKSAP